MSKIDAMWFFQKMSLGLVVVNAIGMALADKKITVSEMIQIVQPVVQVVAPDVKIMLRIEQLDSYTLHNH